MYVAQFPHTSVCKRYIFSFINGKFLRFLLWVANLLTFNMYKDWLLDGLIFKIIPFFAKLFSCPVSTHLVQFPHIAKTAFSRENARSKLIFQSFSCMVIALALRFLNKIGLATALESVNRNYYSVVA